METAFAICVSRRPPLTPLHCVVDMRVAPEKYRFIPKGVPIVSRESIMELARIIHDGLSQNR